MKRAVIIALSIIACIALFTFIIAAGYLKMPVTNTAFVVADPANRHSTDMFNKHLVDTAIILLKSGDIVLRKGTGADSYLLSMLNKKDKTYSHCGIVMIENGYPFVYHSIGGEDNPGETLRRDSATFFFSPLHNTTIAIIRYDLDSQKISALRRSVGQFYARKPKFDVKFDLATDDKLYCSEFVYKALNRATGDNTYIGTSSISGNIFVAIDDLFINPHARFIWQTKFKQYLYTQK